MNKQPSRRWRFIRALIRIFYREPDFIIGGAEDPYIRRWWVIPRNRFFNIYLHNQVRDDDDRALHDHPWVNVSIILKGGYIEWKPRNGEHYHCGKIDPPCLVGEPRRRFHVIFRRPTAEHRLELHRDRFTNQPISSWSLFITGPKVREWGFWCNANLMAHKPLRWVHWRAFTDPTDTGKTGKGCDA